MRSAEATWEAPCRQAGPSSTWEQVVAQEGFYATWCSVTDVRDPGVFREPQNTLPPHAVLPPTASCPSPPPTPLSRASKTPGSFAPVVNKELAGRPSRSTSGEGTR